MFPWLSQHFFNPTYVLGGSALVALPVIIHLINRMRFRRVRFAAMEFLLQSQRRNRRRVLLEQLLLLLLRVLLVLGVVALIARLILDPGRMAVFRGAQAHHIVILDDSGSMQDGWEETNAFKQSLTIVRRLVSEAARRPNTVQFSLLLLSNPEHPVCSERDVNDVFLRELENQLDGLHCTHQSFTLSKALGAAARMFADRPGTIRHLHIVSDFRQADWEDAGAIASAVQQLDKAGVSLNFVRAVGVQDANLTVTGITGDLQVAAARVPLRLKVTVRNDDERVATDVRLDVLQDGVKLPFSVQFEKIEGDTEVAREFDVQFDTAGMHRIEVVLPADSLASDNTGYLVVDVQDVNRILIIDGDPRASEASYLADALGASPNVTGFAPRIESVEFLRRRSLDEFQSIFMLNVAELPPDAVDPLARYVDEGGGLAWFLGDTVQPVFYNDVLLTRNKNLFPVPLAPVPAKLSHDDATIPGPDLQFADDPIFRIFTGKENPYIDATRVFQYYPVTDDWNRNDQERDDGVRTIGWLRNKAPLVLMHRFGHGRVITCLTSCGPSWNNWCYYASYVVLQLEIQKSITRTDRVPEVRTVGEPIRAVLDPAEFSETIEIKSPSRTGEQITRIKAASMRQDSASTDAATDSGRTNPIAATTLLQAVHRDTDRPGFYSIRLMNRNQIPSEKWIAYNVPNHESRLAIATSSDIRKQLGDDVAVAIQEPGDFHWIEGKDAGQEMRHWLLALLVILLACEQLLANRLSYHPK